MAGREEHSRHVALAVCQQLLLELSSAAEASGVMVRVRGRLHGFEASKKDCSFQFIDCSWWSLPRDERRTVDASPLQFIDSSCWSSPVGFE